MEKESHKPTGAGVTSLPDSSHKEKKGPHKTGPRVNQCMLELPVKRYITIITFVKGYGVIYNL